MTQQQFWPGGARLAVSFSLMFEGGGQPISGAGGVIPDPIEGGLPDLPTNADGVAAITEVTGVQPVGWNAYWMRNSRRTLDILQSLGFRYHIDEPSRDEPFIVPLKGGDFVTVPYTFHMNDIVSFPFEGWNPTAYEQALRDEFDQLYEEGAHRRRMMVVSLHDRISKHADRVRVLDRFLAYARQKPNVWFARKDEIAAHAMQTKNVTPVIRRGPPTETGLPGPTA